jgi:hypothetical protein
MDRKRFKVRVETDSVGVLVANGVERRIARWTFPSKGKERGQAE